jgi:uncharacterized protein involved in cysteine biosynthesis
MHIIVNFIIGVLISCCLFFLGRYAMAHPDRIVRMFTREERPAKSWVAFVRFIGNFFLILGVLGIALYLFLIVGDLIGRHG